MAKKDRAKGEQRRAAREERREAQRREAARRRQRQRVRIWTIAGAVVVASIGLSAWGGLLGPQAAAFLGRNIQPPPGERVSTLAPVHIAEGTRGSGYTTNPPTSGDHYQSQAPWGVHTQPLPDELLVHSLEHGGIWISYKTPNDTELTAKLGALAGRYARKVIMTPRPQNDAPIAVAAWGRLLKLQQFDEEKIVAFIDAYRGKVGPEPLGP